MVSAGLLYEVIGFFLKIHYHHSIDHTGEWSLAKWLNFDPFSIKTFEYGVSQAIGLKEFFPLYNKLLKQKWVTSQLEIWDNSVQENGSANEINKLEEKGRMDENLLLWSKSTSESQVIPILQVHA